MAAENPLEPDSSIEITSFEIPRFTYVNLEPLGLEKDEIETRFFFGITHQVDVENNIVRFGLRVSTWGYREGERLPEAGDENPHELDSGIRLSLIDTMVAFGGVPIEALPEEDENDYTIETDLLQEMLKTVLDGTRGAYFARLGATSYAGTCVPIVNVEAMLRAMLEAEDG